MHRILALVAGALLLSWPAASARADLQIGATITDDGLRSFHLAVGDYYRVPEREIIVVRERHVPDDELPVVFFLADRAHRPPAVIVEMRLAGESWVDIAWHFGLGSEIFYVPLERDPGPPYGRAYGHYKRAKRSEWPRLRLSDVDVVNLVNLRFISDHYRCSPYEVTRLRRDHRSFVRLAGEIDRHRHGDDDDDDDRGKSKHGRDRGRGRGHGRH